MPSDHPAPVSDRVDTLAGAIPTQSTAAATSPATSAVPSPRSRRIALGVLCMGILMIILDSTVVNVALPSIQRDLGFSQSSLAWVVNAYLVAFGGLLLLAGRLGDLVGRRRVFLAGIAVFTLASLACGLAQNETLLITARFVQGVGGALSSAVILGMIVTMFPAPREQAAAIGLYSFVASAGASIGLLAGGVLTEAVNWHWIFFINIPIGAATAFLALRVVESDKGSGWGDGADGLGAGLVTGALMIGVYAIVQAAENGWASRSTIAFGAASLALLAGFVTRQATVRNPLIPLRLFRSRTVVGANVVQVLMVAGLFGVFFLGALYMQRVLGFGALQTGLAFLPVAVLIGVFSLGFSARLSLRFGIGGVLIGGLVLVAAGLAYFSRTPADGSYLADMLPAMVLLGIGAGLVFPALTTMAMSGADRSDSGLASGLFNTTQQMGGALGLAILATLSTTRTADLQATGEPAIESLVGGYRFAFLCGAGLVAAAVVIAVVLLRTERES